MARLALVRALIVAAAAALCSVPAAAQNLQRLTVTALTLSANTVRPHIEQPFQLIVTAHVREEITELDNVNLPILAELELLGDEHTLAAGPGGSTYREVIDVVAHHSGSITIAPVTLDAIDARDGRAKRYFSNALTLQVQGGLANFTPRRRVPWIPVLFGVVSAAICWIVLTLRRRPFAPPPPPPAPATLPAPVPVTRDPRARFREWLAALRARPDRGGAMSVRSVVRRAVGADDTQTLADVLQRPLAQDPAMRELLRALERAGFTYESDVPAAVSAAIAHLEEMAR